jgi:hypothetical protein
MRAIAERIKNYPAPDMIMRYQVTVTRFAWCFDHGRSHNFSTGAWCTAFWVKLAGQTEAEALADKQTRFGDAVFYDQLTLEQQGALIENRSDQQENPR